MAAALALARSRKAYVAGLYVIAEPDLSGFVRAQIPDEVLEEQRARAEETAEAAVAAFRELAEREGVAADGRIARAQAHEVAALIALQARYADLVIAGQAAPEEPGPGGRQMVADLVLSAGRPVLVIPYIGVARPIGRTVTVAWAVADAMPFLEAAERVHVLVVNPVTGAQAHGPEPGADIALSLARHGVKAEVEVTSAPDIEEGEAILSWLADSGSDLLVMGAYGHGRMRELVLGGVSRLVLESMTCPVLMAH
jgi:nucleotide-binding universal stress UspA family protein